MSKPRHSGGQRRTRINEMDRIDAKEVRPTVKPRQGLAYFPTAGGVVWLELIWRKHAGGTFGSGSAAYANRLRTNIADFYPFKDEHIYTTKDRGLREGWIMYLGCPTCSQRCRVLYSKKGSDKFECIRCSRPAYPSNCWPCTGRRDAHTITKTRREIIKHEHAAARQRKLISKARSQQEKELLRLAMEQHLKLSFMLSVKLLLHGSH